MDNLESKLYNALRELGQQAINFIQASMEKNGINDKTGTNTLINSNLYNDLVFEANPDNELVLILINNYYVYVEGGRSVGAKWPPVNVIADWAARKGLPTNNGFIFLVCRSIVEKGISPRPFMGEAMDMLEAYYETWADNVFEEIMSGIIGFFS